MSRFSRDAALVATVLGLSTAACELDTSQQTATVKPQQAQEDTSARPNEQTVDSNHDRPSLQPITLSWQRSNAGQRDAFPVRVVNNSEQIYDVSLHLEGEGPGVAPRLESFLEFDLAPAEERVIPVALDDLPVQSSVHPSSLRVVARYRSRDQSAPVAPILAEDAERTSFTTPLLVTSSEDFKSAVARTIAEQKADNDERVSELSKRGETRVRGPSGSYRAAQHAESGIEEGPISIVSRLPIPVDPHLVPPRAPDTEPEEEEH